MCREQEVHREELTAVRTWPCLMGWENWSFFSCSERCCLNPICPDPPYVLRWPALECTCSTGPVHDDFMRCTIRKPTCADFMGCLCALLSFVQQEKPLSTGSGIYSTALKRSGGPYFARFIFDGNSESYNITTSEVVLRLGTHFSICTACINTWNGNRKSPITLGLWNLIEQHPLIRKVVEDLFRAFISGLSHMTMVISVSHIERCSLLNLRSICLKLFRCACRLKELDYKNLVSGRVGAFSKSSSRYRSC